MEFFNGLYGGIMLFVFGFSMCWLGAFLNIRASAKVDATAERLAMVKELRTLYERELAAATTAAIIRQTTCVDHAIAASCAWARDMEERKRREASMRDLGLGGMNPNPYTGHWHGSFRGNRYWRQTEDSNVRTGVDALDVPKPECLIQRMQQHAQVLREQGYTVACTIKPPPATRKL